MKKKEKFTVLRPPSQQNLECGHFMLLFRREPLDKILNLFILRCSLEEEGKEIHQMQKAREQ